VTKLYERAENSNWGPVVDIYAPGQEIWSASHKGDSYMLVKKNGTSFAAPHVAGLMAMFVGWENLHNSSEHVDKAIKRLYDNAQKNLLTIEGSKNLLANSGQNHPEKQKGVPYKGAPDKPV